MRKNSNGCLGLLALAFLAGLVILVFTALPYYLVALAAVSILSFCWGLGLMAFQIVRTMMTTESSGLFFREGPDPRAKEPARTRFFYYKGDCWLNWKGVMTSVIRLKFNSPVATAQYIGQRWEQWRGQFARITRKPIFYYFLVVCAFPVLLACLLSKYIGHVGGSLVVSLLLLVFWGLAFLTTNLFCLVVVAIDGASGLVRRVFRHHTACNQCRKELTQASYRCPRCNKLHHELKPSLKYGVFFHSCYCGTPVPASALWGRDFLEPFCHGGRCS